MRFHRKAALVALLAATNAAAAEPDEAASKPAPPWYDVHFQFTAVTQTHPSFPAKYSGQNSLSPNAETTTAFITTLSAAFRLWHGAQLIFDPEMNGGEGFSHTQGVAAFPNGLVYRVGNPLPTVYVARLALRQVFGLGGGRTQVDPGPNEIGGVRDRNTLTLQFGRFALTDWFAQNAYAHDPTTEFFNWALFAPGAWDYAADTRGYTWGFVADLTMNWWSLRAGVALEPETANGLQLQVNLALSRALMAEYEARYSLKGRAGDARLLLFVNDAPMGNYQQVLDNPAKYQNNVSNDGAFGRLKYGFALSIDQAITKTLGGFLLASWNDGANESWAFTEIDRSLALGAVQNGAPWHRPDDHAGLALVVNGLSTPHLRYLEGGGYGFIIGDGALRYGPETLLETYYDALVVNHLALSVIYQLIVDPAYNRDRGPVNVFTGRLHVQF